MTEQAKNMFGMGPGTKYNPIKASAIVEDDDEEEKMNEE